MPLILPGNVGSATATTGYDVANSLRFDDGSSDYLNRTPSSAGNRRTFTISFWVKRSNISALMKPFSAGAVSSPFTAVEIESTDQLRFVYFNGTSLDTDLGTNRLFRDVSAWYHIVCSVDTTQATESNRVKLYVNGNQETSFDSSHNTYPAQNFDFNFNNNQIHEIGRGVYNSAENFDGYLAEFIMIDGTQLDPTSFGEFDEDTGIWKPIDVSGLTFGTNGFYLDFEDSSALGNDVSGNNNDFASSGLAAIDQSTDTCTNNAVTFMPNTPSASNFTLSQGNLKIDKSGSGTFGLYGSSIMLSNGKWYWEAKMTGDAGSDRTRVGLAAYESVTGTSSIQGSYSGFEFTSVTSGRFSITVDGSTTEVDGFNSYSTGNIIRFALDMDNTKLYVGINGDWFNYNSSNTGGDPTSGSGWVTNNATALAAPVTIYAGHAVGVSGSSELEFNFGATNTFFSFFRKFRWQWIWKF